MFYSPIVFMKKKNILALALTMLCLTGLSSGCGKSEPASTESESSATSETETASVEATKETETTDTETTATETTNTETESTETTTPETETVPETFPEITSNEAIQDFDSVLVIGNTAYELFTYREQTAESYSAAVNHLANTLDGKAKVYDMVIPLSSGITFPDNRLSEINSSDQKESIDSIHKKLNDKVNIVPIYNTLMSHRNEYIYFRTDHHWTALGAYYAYTSFCEAKGIEPASIDSYEQMQFDGFVGSFYNDTKASVLKQNPDTITAYKPVSDAILHVTASDGQEYDWPVIYDVSSYAAGLKYSSFCAGDNPITVVENKSLTDNSSCIVVKESFGNAFIPFLVDHYQTIYIIDYRYWKGSVSALAEEKQVSDVLLLNNLSMIRNKYLVGQLQGVM